METVPVKKPTETPELGPKPSRPEKLPEVPHTDPQPEIPPRTPEIPEIPNRDIPDGAEIPDRGDPRQPAHGGL